MISWIQSLYNNIPSFPFNFGPVLSSDMFTLDNRPMADSPVLEDSAGEMPLLQRKATPNRPEFIDKALAHILTIKTKSFTEDLNNSLSAKGKKPISSLMVFAKELYVSYLNTFKPGAPEHSASLYFSLLVLMYGKVNKERPSEDELLFVADACAGFKNIKYIRKWVGEEGKKIARDIYSGIVGSDFSNNAKMKAQDALLGL